MDGILSIDAAWTAKEPSGVALLAGTLGEWWCVNVTPSYDSFLALAEGVTVDWTVKTRGGFPEASRLVTAAQRLLGGRKVAVVTADMPLATTTITGRRVADNAISRSFGGKGASTHSPSVDQPGIISSQLHDAFADSGFPLATHATPEGTPERLVEVYPHPALLTLTGASRRLPYKVNNSRRYWKGSSAAEREVKLLEQIEKILTALRADIRGIELKLPEPEDAVSITRLKRYEDSLNALVCA
jgi:predicted RNase H-like nuclease